MFNYINIYKKLIICLLSCFLGFSSMTIDNPKVGQVIDSLNGVSIRYNGTMHHVAGRNLTPDGYNLGLKWQCVEFVKRYYYERFGHKMPNSYGHAKDFFNNKLADIEYNKERDLIQYRNVRYSKPEVDDIVVYDGYKHNPYGHIGIIAEVGADHITLVQQNVGRKSRVKLKLVEFEGIYTIADFNILGWLRLQ